MFEFVELEGFADDWKDLGHDDTDFFKLQDLILAWPKLAPIIPGTGGARKLRFVSARQRSGKRGAARVCYAFFEEHGIVLLIGAYAKVRKSDLMPSDKKAIRRLIESAAREHSRKQRTSRS